MTPAIIIPVRAARAGKTRLAAVLPPEGRAALVRRMFAHVLAVAGAAAPGAVRVISNDPAMLALAAAAGAEPLRERAHGLNPALEQAREGLDPAAPVLALSADLPLLTRDDLAAMIALLDTADVIAAPDRAGHGTNALLLARPGLIDYAFGIGSLAAHRAAAQARGLRFATCERPGLASDIDWPADLSLLSAA